MYMNDTRRRQVGQEACGVMSSIKLSYEHSTVTLRLARETLQKLDPT